MADHRPLGWSRRAFLLSAPAGAIAQQIASEQHKYRDPLTEFELLQLTDPKISQCFLPAPPLRAIGRSNAMLYCSDRPGSMQAYRMDLKSGESRQITSASNLDPRTVSLLADDRSICYCDGDSVWVGAGRNRSVYSAETGWSRTGRFAVAEDGNSAILIERKEMHWRVRLVNLLRAGAITVAESDVPVQFAAARPRRAGLFYTKPDGLYIVNYDGQQNRRLRTSSPEVLAALWSADGRSIFYIARTGRTHEMREHVPDTNEDKLVARTTQFVSFARNANASVFAGVSGSVAAPYVLILLRTVRRELTVAEHKASKAENVSVQFSSNGQRLFYQTDRQGRSAIYMMNLERFIEDTDNATTGHWTQRGEGDLALDAD